MLLVHYSIVEQASPEMEYVVGASTDTVFVSSVRIEACESSLLSEPEIAYLKSQPPAWMAIVASKRQPDVVPDGF